MLVKLDHFTKDRGENKKCLKPPSSLFLFLHNFKDYSPLGTKNHLPDNWIQKWPLCPYINGLYLAKLLYLTRYMDVLSSCIWLSNLRSCPSPIISPEGLCRSYGRGDPNTPKPEQFTVWPLKQIDAGGDGTFPKKSKNCLDTSDGSHQNVQSQRCCLFLSFRGRTWTALTTEKEIYRAYEDNSNFQPINQVSSFVVSFPGICRFCLECFDFDRFWGFGIRPFPPHMQKWSNISESCWNIRVVIMYKVGKHLFFILSM